jgi:DegT/DnrJ/EryC1/StrS aminotransferase family protein
MMLRRQPPVYSPITLRGVGVAAAQAIGSGAVTERLERRLCRQYGADLPPLLFGSGTQALQVALRLALRRVAGSAVALPTFTCFDVAAAAVAVGARIVLYDVDPASLGPDLDSLGRALDQGARVVIVTPLFGYPVDWEAIEATLAPREALAIEDAAQGFQARWRGRLVGSFGRLSVLSFGRGKGWTGGAGGALLLRGAGWTGIDVLSGNGQDGSNEWRVLSGIVAQWLFGRPGWYAVPAALPWLGLGETIYRDAPPPQRISRAAAACIEAVWNAAEREAAKRQMNGVGLRAMLESEAPGLTIRCLPDAAPGYLRLPVRLARGLGAFVSPAHARRLGVLPSYPSTLAAIPQVGARLNGAGDRYPGGEELARSLFTVPTHSLMTDSERQELVRLLIGYPR